jgi:hypothetical protein
MDDMRAGADQPVLTPWLPAPSGNPPDPGQWTAGGGGKPELKPWRADSIDLSLEKYFQKRSYVAVAGFFKDLKSFIYERESERDFSGFPNYNPALTPGCAPSQPDCDPNIGTITTQDNGSGGEVYGFEVSTSLDGSLFTPALDGIGVILSYSKTENSLPNDDNGNPINLDGSPATSTASGRTSRGAFLGPDRPVVPLVVYGDHARRDTEHTEKHAHRCRVAGRRAAQLQVRLRRAQRPDAAAAGEQPHQRALSYTAIAGNRGRRRLVHGLAALA